MGKSKGQGFAIITEPDGTKYVLTETAVRTGGAYTGPGRTRGGLTLPPATEADIFWRARGSSLDPATYTVPALPVSQPGYEPSGYDPGTGQTSDPTFNPYGSGPPTGGLPGTNFGGGPPVTSSNIDVGQVAAAGPGLCAVIFGKDPSKLATCLAIAATAAAVVGKGNTTSTQTTTPGGGCPKGWHMTAGGCAQDGVQRQDLIPGTQRGEYAFQAGNGMYGAAVAPVNMSTVTRRCPGGWVLGNDGMCYQHLERRFRAHLPARKPLLTANDGRILTKARSLEKKLKRVAGKHVRKARSCSCAKPGRKK